MQLYILLMQDMTQRNLYCASYAHNLMQMFDSANQSSCHYWCDHSFSMGIVVPSHDTWGHHRNISPLTLPDIRMFRVGQFFAPPDLTTETSGWISLVGSEVCCTTSEGQLQLLGSKPVGAMAWLAWQRSECMVSDRELTTRTMDLSMAVPRSAGWFPYPQ